MRVQLTRDRKEDAVREVSSLWEWRERRRLEILIAVDQQKPRWPVAKGGILRRTRKRPSSPLNVKRRGRERLAAEQRAPSVGSRMGVIATA
jgi:hypothetical protein